MKSLSENSPSHSSEKWANRLYNALGSAQLLPVGILLNFFVLAATFVDWDTFFTDNSAIVLIYNFSGTMFISVLLASTIWLVQAVRGNTRVEYFRHQRLFIIVEQLTFMAWLLNGIAFSAFSITLSESAVTCFFSASCGLGMLTYFLITMFAEKTSKKPKKCESKKLNALATALTMVSVIDDLD